MGAKLSINQNDGSRTPQTKKRSFVPQNIRLSTNQLLKRNIPTPPMSPQGSDAVESAVSLGSGTDSFNYIDNTQKSEADRNHVKHFALKVLFEGNVLKSIRDNLDFNSADLCVLDIGCGSGAWLLDMATEHPNVQFTGVDQVAVYPQDIRPSNINFLVGDVLDGLSFEDNSFDLVQMRLFSMTFDRTLWDQALKEVYRIVKPGGYIQLLEVQYKDIGDEVVASYVEKVVYVLSTNDQDPDICKNLSPLLAKNDFIPVEFVEKPVSLKSHLLKTEMVYVIKLTMDSCKPYLYRMCDIKTEQEYNTYQARYLKHRIETSESVWTACAGMKPLP